MGYSLAIVGINEVEEAFVKFANLFDDFARVHN